MTRSGALVVLCAVLTFCIPECSVLGQQSATNPQEPGSLRQQLLERIRELYGADAPNEITFIDTQRAVAENVYKPAGSEQFPKVNPSIFEPGAETTKQENAFKGQVATGVVLLEQLDQLYLDARPCNGVIVSFRKPYRRERTGTVRCGGSDLPQETLTQN